ncbi:hypothetical protein CUMW_084960 [Citrus unshiu]|nr:hypothetical protein CUMW_084960 [Citrus unshiu]
MYLKETGTDAIEGIFLDLSKIKDINLDPGAFTNMSNMRLLKFYVPEFLHMSIEEQLSYSKVQLPNGLDYLPKKLRYLHWDTYPLRTLPSNFKPKNLVELNLRFSKVEQLWEGKKNFKYLSALSFEGCRSLMSFPSNLHFVCPVTINFSSCVSLIEFPQISGKITRLYLDQSAIEEVPSSIECLTDLKVLDLKDCKRLKTISTRFCKLRSLVDLFLSGCLNLERFPEILEKMEHLKHIYLGHTAITELPSSFENLPGLEVLFVEDCSKLDKLPDNIGNLESLRYIFAVGSAISELPSSVADSNVLRRLDFSRCKELPLCLQSLNASNCNRLQSLPEIPSCLQELDTSVLEKLSKPSPDLRQWAPGHLEAYPVYFWFINCLKLNGNANNKILADSLLIIRRMAIASLRLGYEKAINEKLSELWGSLIVLPGSEIPDWFSHQSSESSICIQLPPQSFCGNLIGFAFCAVLDSKKVCSRCKCDWYVIFQADLEIKTLSETKYVDLGFSTYSKYSLDSDHVILCFKPCLNVGFPDGYHHTTVSLKFFNECYRNQKGHKIKRYGVCPVYANRSEIKANTFTLNFGTEVWKLDDLPSASGTAASEFDSSSDEGELYYSFDEEELEPSPRRTCRDDQINTP